MTSGNLTLIALLFLLSYNDTITLTQTLILLALLSTTGCRRLFGNGDNDSRTTTTTTTVTS